MSLSVLSQPGERPLTACDVSEALPGLSGQEQGAHSSLLSTRWMKPLTQAGCAAAAAKEEVGNKQSNQSVASSPANYMRLISNTKAGVDVCMRVCVCFCCWIFQWLPPA